MLEFTDIRDLGRALKSLRLERGVSQSELARLLGVDPSRVCRWEESDYKRTKLSMVCRALEALGCQVEITIADKAS
jgi:transcriptional regulator with XRE-family HTH domain